MKSVLIYLDKGRLVKSFVEEISRMNGSFQLKADRTILDAKSILGIYSLDLSKPLLLQIDDDDYDIGQLREYIVK